MNKIPGNDSSTYAGKKATLTVPKSTGRHNDKKMKPVAGHVCKGGKIKK